MLKIITKSKRTKAQNILELDAKNFIEDWEKACEALEIAYKRILDLKGYGILDFKKWMPYSAMLIPLAAMIAYIKAEKLEVLGTYEKIDRCIGLLYSLTDTTKRLEPVIDIELKLREEAFETTDCTDFQKHRLRKLKKSFSQTKDELLKILDNDDRKNN
jgi:hypothetical protein